MVYQWLYTASTKLNYEYKSHSIATLNSPSRGLCSSVPLRSLFSYAYFFDIIGLDFQT